jgi:23S rRNA (adenine2503-C2)-methyltransferase
LSTVGLVEGIRRLANEPRHIKLAVSLHATTDAVRLELMPINKKYPLAAIMEAVEYYYRKTHRPVTYEYILFAGINDSDEDVNRLAKLTRRIPSKVNIIPFHPIENAYPNGIPLQLSAASSHRMQYFANALREQGVRVMLRTSSGHDIDAACGQLAVKHGEIGINHI